MGYQQLPRGGSTHSGGVPAATARRLHSLTAGHPQRWGTSSYREAAPLTHFLSARRTGTRAWVDDAVPGAAAVYHTRMPALLEAVAEHYGLPSINLIPALTALPSQVPPESLTTPCV